MCYKLSSDQLPTYFNTYRDVLMQVPSHALRQNLIHLPFVKRVYSRVGVKYTTCTWYLYLSTYLSVLDVLEYLVYGNAKVLVLVLVLDQKVLGTYK